MEGRDLIVAARRGAGLTQTELAGRLGRAQPTISAWESGKQRPSFEVVFAAVRACGQELTVGLRKGDDSYNALIRGQLRMNATQRISSLTAVRGVDISQIVDDLVGAGTGFVVVGRVAAAAHGWPITLDDCDALIEVVPASLQAFEKAATQLSYEPAGEAQWYLGSRARLVAHEQMLRTHGYVDLARDAESIEIAGAAVRVASLIDLVRIAEGNPESSLRSFVPALWSTLEMVRRRRHEDDVALGTTVAA